MNFENDYYDNQRKRDFQRNLTHLRYKNKFKNKEPWKFTQRQIPKSMLLNVTDQELQPQEPPIKKAQPKVKVQDLKTLLNKMTVKSNVKQFISKLKQFKTHDQKMITNFESISIEILEEKINRNIERSKLFSLLTLQGIIFTDRFNLFIYLLTFFSLFYINLLSTFQCFLDQFRSTETSLLWVKLSQIFVIIVIITKIITSFIIQKNVNGYKLTLIVDIAKRYIFSTNSAIDLLLLITTILMFYFYDRVSVAVLVYLMSLLRIIMLERIDDAIAKHLLINFKTKQYYSLFRLLLANFFLAHFFGSVFLALASVQQDTNWITKYQIQYSHWFQKYLYSVYWAASITTTVGFGDITVDNQYQALLMTFVMLIGCLVLSYNISQVANIFHNLKDRRDEIQTQLFNLNVLAKVARIDETLHKKIADYLINSFQIKFRFQEQEAKQIVSKLPQNLREEFMEQNSKNFFSKMPFFYILKSQTKMLLIEKINMNILPPNQHLTRNARNRHGFRKVFALRFGEVGLGYKKKGSQINGHIVDKLNVNMGDYPLLLNAFLLNRKKKLQYSIICLTFCNVLSFEFDQMRQCLQQVPYDFQLWRQLYDSDKYLSIQLIQKKCQLCDQYHSKFNCPKLVYIPLRSIIYRKKILQKIDEFSPDLFKNNPYLVQMLRNYFIQVRRKKKYSKKTSLKFWKRVFAPLQRLQFLSVQRLKKKISTNQTNPERNFSNNEDNETMMRKTKRLKRKIKQGNKYKITQFVTEGQIFQVDAPHDFQNYFPKCNPKKLVKIELLEYEIPLTMYRMAST